MLIADSSGDQVCNDVQWLLYLIFRAEFYGYMFTTMVRLIGERPSLVYPNPTTVRWTHQVGAFTQRYLRSLSRSKLILALAIAWPVAWYLLTMEFFIPSEEQVGAIKANNAISFGLFGAFTVTVAVFAGAFAGDLESGRFRMLRSLPISPTADLTGRFLAGLAIAVPSFLVTIGAGYVHGATYSPRGLLSIPVAFLTLFVFCLIAMALSMGLAVLITKPEYITTLAVVIVIMSFFLTGFNGVQPAMLAENQALVNYVPNALAARVQIFYLTDADFAHWGLTPPAMPDGIEHLGLLVGYGLVLLVASVVVMQRVAYRRE
ncbi:ABC transporter permease [Natronococcus zhouii]|nr:ABC transporter permease [Natronococcus sp. CG52]